MFRALFSVAIVLLLSTIALLLYRQLRSRRQVGAWRRYCRQERCRLPLPPTPMQPIQQPAPPVAAPVVDKDVKDGKDLKDTKKETRAHDKKASPEKPGAGQQTYVVEAGDSLWSISTKLYGSGEYTTKIAEMNHMTLKDRIRPGQVLLAPDAPKQERVNKHEMLARDADSDMSSDAAKDPVKDTATEAQPESDPLTTTNTSKPHEDELEIQPPLLNVEVKK